MFAASSATRGSVESASRQLDLAHGRRQIFPIHRRVGRGERTLEHGFFHIEFPQKIRRPRLDERHIPKPFLPQRKPPAINLLPGRRELLGPLLSSLSIVGDGVGNRLAQLSDIRLIPRKPDGSIRIAFRLPESSRRQVNPPAFQQHRNQHADRLPSAFIFAQIGVLDERAGLIEPSFGDGLFNLLDANAKHQHLKGSITAVTPDFSERRRVYFKASGL